jgi:hypothetical protein
MTDKGIGDPEPPGGTDPGVAQPASEGEEDTSAYGEDGSASTGLGDPEPPGGTGDPEPPGNTGGG